MKEDILCLDCDGVIFDDLELINQELSKIDYLASDEYKTTIQSLIEERAGNYSENLELLEKHNLLKDQILEEVFSQYQKKIPYSKIFVLENTFPGVVETIKKIWLMGRFKKIYVVTHCNSHEEIKCKKNFFRDYLPFVEFVPIKFHATRYFYDDLRDRNNMDRERSNKIKIFNLLFDGLEMDKIYFIDDSKSICDEVNKEGAHALYRSSKTTSVELLNSLMEKKEKRKK